jgi:glycine cleavage system H protein
MQAPSELRYTKSHEWCRIEDGICTVGITDFAVEEMNKEIVNIDLPEVGDTVRLDESFGILDAVKASFDLYAPMSGTIEEVNASVLEDPTLAAEGPYTDGWMVKIRISKPEEAGALMDPEAYLKHIESESQE